MASSILSGCSHTTLQTQNYELASAASGETKVLKPVRCFVTTLSLYVETKYKACVYFDGGFR